MMLRRFVVSAAAVGVVLLAPAAASADSYLVTSCHDPLGQPNAAAALLAAFKHPDALLAYG
jgi:predicted outer membrane protein